MVGWMCNISTENVVSPEESKDYFKLNNMRKCLKKL